MNLLIELILLLQKAGEFSKSFEGRKEGPGGIIDYIIVGIAVLIVVVVFVLGIKFFIQPKEQSETHIKRRILKDEF